LRKKVSHRRLAALAAVLEESAAPRVPPLVQLKAGSAGPRLLITHGLGGSVMDFFQVIKHIQRPTRPDDARDLWNTGEGH
jgi:hypothetical protein